MIKRNAKTARQPKINSRYVLIHYETKESEGNFWGHGTGGPGLTPELIKKFKDQIRKDEQLEDEDYVIIKNIMGL